MGWLPVNGYENYYMISSHGDIYSKRLKRLLKPHKAKSGYLYISLRGDGKNKFMTMHRLIAMHFVPGYKEGLCVNHIDENKSNNSANNLEWCTKAYNNTYNGKAKRCCKAVKQLDFDGVLIKTWEGAREASRELSIQYKNISACCRGKRKSAGGYIWRFA